MKKISWHAIERYRERIGPLSENHLMATTELYEKLLTAKSKRLRELFLNGENRSTLVVAAEDCVFVADHGVIVTVLERREPN